MQIVKNLEYEMSKLGHDLQCTKAAQQNLFQEMLNLKCINNYQTQLLKKLLSVFRFEVSENFCRHNYIFYIMLCICF